MARTHSRGAHAGKPAPLPGGRDARPRVGSARGTRARGARAGDTRVGETRVGGVRSRSTRARVVAASCATAMLLIGVALGWASPEPSAEPTVQAFLLDWQNRSYAAAAAQTTGAPAQVAAALHGAYQQLGAADLIIAMGSISQHGATADASFSASIDLGRGGPPWSYQGSFRLRRVGATWKVVWSPSVIVPGLRPGLRLAVLDTMPPRGQILDAKGRPLASPSLVYTVGVYPDRLKNPERTVAGLAGATGLSESQVLSWVNVAPSGEFLELLRLSWQSYHRLGGRLSHVPGLVIKQERLRLLDSTARAVSGSVGTEAAGLLQQEGIPYRPGVTVGLSGLQQTFQRTLVGAPTTEVVEESPAGHVVSVLQRWLGHGGTDVHTTIDSRVQNAADHAIRSLPASAAIVAVSTTTGRVLAVAQHKARSMPLVKALAGHYQPGQAFTIVSTAALLDTGLGVNERIPCGASNPVGGENFTNVAPVPNLGTFPFRTDFAQACSTAFAGLSVRLSAKDLLRAADGFGLGKPWQLPLPVKAFTGSLRAPAGQAQVAEDSIGTGSVQVSPLDMAIAAEVVQSGTWRPPMLVTPDPGLTPTVPFGVQVVSALKALMRTTVTSGAGREANVGGAPVYGQVGSAPLGSGRPGLRTDWFVGFQGNVAFAVVELTRSARGSVAAPLAGQFLRDLRAGI
jgi:cell division protein FtsI/penicillin-binding protein 2